MKRLTADLGMYNGVLDAIAELLQLRSLIESLRLEGILTDEEAYTALRVTRHKIKELLQVLPEQAMG